MYGLCDATPTVAPISTGVNSQDFPPCPFGYSVQTVTGVNAPYYPNGMCLSNPGAFPSAKSGALSCDGLMPSQMADCQGVVTTWNQGYTMRYAGLAAAGAVLLLADGWMKVLALPIALFSMIETKVGGEGM